MMQKISRKVLPANTKVAGDVFIRGVRTKYESPDMTHVIFTLGPTPQPIWDNPEEFSLDVSINVRSGMSFMKVVEAVHEILAKGLAIYVQRSHITQ